VKQLVEFALPDGETILIEVDEPEVPGATIPASRVGKMAVDARLTFEEALDKINLKPMVKAIKKKFDEMEESADEIEVKFAIKLSGQAGAFITVGGEASYEVTMRWNKSS